MEARPGACLANALANNIRACSAWLRTLSSCSPKKFPKASADAKVLAEKRLRAGGNFKGSKRLKCCVRAATKWSWCVAASDARPSSRRTSEARGMAAARNEPILVEEGRSAYTKAETPAHTRQAQASPNVYFTKSGPGTSPGLATATACTHNAAPFASDTSSASAANQPAPKACATLFTWASLRASRSARYKATPHKMVMSKAPSTEPEASGAMPLSGHLPCFSRSRANGNATRPAADTAVTFCGANAATAPPDKAPTAQTMTPTVA
mmetsp:Transcript_20316/g.52902  ORF Transcript_20316/g.52902 Transcript_20316/m.52902 type:complete len:267 (+) Transcript_20316:5856-6656(+)